MLIPSKGGALVTSTITANTIVLGSMCVPGDKHYLN